ncbi:MAG: HD domain-containing protein [Bacilli bacterium]|nr:HD domain-containing protein [Bacilli bacterium]
MNIELKAREFAILAHKGQIRKSDPEKPMIIHPINVAQILKQYGFDENVIAAGYLHDVVEDTSYEINDIKNKFGDDIASLVNGASEPDKSLSWEERKKHTIKETKKLDLRHKVVICADKISNLEDLRILFEIKGEYDFSSFKRGFDKQKWYYEEVYNSLIFSEDENHPMFVRLKELIDYIFDDKKDDDYVKNVIFKDNLDEYQKLKKIHYRKEEVYKLKKVLYKQNPYVIEFTGTPRTGKTSLINNLKDFFKKKGFSVEVLEEFTTSEKYKKEIYPTLKDKYKNVVNTEIPKYVLKQLEESINKNPDIIIIDRSLFDRLIWVDRLVLKNGMSIEEYNNYKNKYIPLIKEKIDIVIATYTDSITVLKRDYTANLSLEKRNFLNETNVEEYNKSLLNMEKLASIEKINFKLFDTTNKNQREISFEVIDYILKDMRKNLLNKVKKEFN